MIPKLNKYLCSKTTFNEYSLRIMIGVKVDNKIQLNNSQYDDELDGGIDGGRRKRKKKKAEVNIYDIYEPFDLEKGHFTMQDHEIKMTDLPER